MLNIEKLELLNCVYSDYLEDGYIIELLAEALEHDYDNNINYVDEVINSWESCGNLCFVLDTTKSYINTDYNTIECIYEFDYTYLIAFEFDYHRETFEYITIERL